MKKIYVASRAGVPERVAMWLELRRRGMVITSSWIDEPYENVQDLGALWLKIVEEVQGADAVLVYAALEDFPVRGVLVEAGIALGKGIPVHVVVPGGGLTGPSLRPLGAWANHPLVTRYEVLDKALDALGYGDLRESVV